MLLKRTLAKNKLIKAPQVSLRDFHCKKNTVLIIRNARGIGDILMHRMMFEDFKRIMPECRLVFACPKQYHDLVKDHPYVDEVVDSATLNRFNYLMSYDTSYCDIRYECGMAPYIDKHRADIWAEHCGVILTKHNMHLPFLDAEVLQFGMLQVRQAKNMTMKSNKNCPNVLLCPTAFDNLRSLTNKHIEDVVSYLREKGVFIYSTHQSKIPVLSNLNVPVFTGYGTREWLSFIHAADYVVSVDTASFHYAGGIKKPLVGIFTYADGKYRGKYFDFTLVQKHRDNGDWPCGPCYNHTMCTNPKCKNPGSLTDPKPCLTELKSSEIIDGIEKMFEKYPFGEKITKD
jgi:ADP-heptose:LPS heptosyltransferase